MCRNIKTLANFEPPATDNEIRASALQFVRKLSGSTHPSRANEEAFDRAVAVGLAFGNARRHCRKRLSDGTIRGAIALLPVTDVIKRGSIVWSISTTGRWCGFVRYRCGNDRGYRNAPMLPV